MFAPTSVLESNLPSTTSCRQRAGWAGTPLAGVPSSPKKSGPYPVPVEPYRAAGEAPGRDDGRRRARTGRRGDADALWDLAETVARALDGAEGALPLKLARLLAAQREVEARETALVDAHLALLAERNLYMRRLVEA